MPEAATFPTRRDEAWRYADIGAAERLGSAALGVWKEITLAPGETRCHAMVVGSDEAELHRVRLTLSEGARAEMFTVITRNASCRVEVEVALGKGAHFEFGGITIGGGDAVREFVTVTDHAHPEATSNQVVRAVHWDTAAGNFLGSINVARNAQKTDAAQDFKGLLLEKGASANAVPQLEIFADDVKCAHGATVGQLDEMARYYMEARGIPPQTAKRLLVQAFLGDALVALENEGEQERLLEAALEALGEAV